MIRSGSTRRAATGAAVIVAVAVLGPAAASAQTAGSAPPTPQPAPAPASAQGSTPGSQGPASAAAPDRGRQVAADARYKVRVMEGVLEKSVQQAALRLNEQLRRVSPDLIQLTGAAHARGYRLEGYGLFFDVEVPAAMRQTMGWTARVMRQQQQGVSEAIGSLKRITSDLDPKARAEAERAMAQIELVVRPLPRTRGDRPMAGPSFAGSSMAGSGTAVEAATSSVSAMSSASASGSPSAPAAAAGEAPASMPAAPDADALLWRSPDLAYEEQVREALIGAMLDWGALLPLGADEWLTVAARDNQDVVMPGAAPDVVTIILRVKGSDLADRLSGRLTTDDLRRRVDVREF